MKSSTGFGREGSDNRALGRGEMDGVDASGQGLFQILEHIVGRAWARVLSGSLVQELLKGLQLNQKHHVLQKVAFDEG